MRKQFSILALILFTAVTGAQTASAPLEKPDYATPLAAFKTCARAVIAQDAATIRGSLAIAPEVKPSVDAVLAATDAVIRLQNAVRAKFGNDGVNELRSPGALELKMTAWLKMVDTVLPQNVDDSQVNYQFPEGPGGLPKAGGITVLHVGNVWKVSAASVFNLGDPATAAKAKLGIPSNLKLAAIYNEVAADVESGKHPSVKSVNDSLMSKVSTSFNAQK